MQALITSEIVSSIALLICVIGLLNPKVEKKKSNVALIACACIQITANLFDSLAYTTDGIGLPDPLLYFINYMAFVMGYVTYIVFAMYCRYLVEPRIKINIILFRIPIILISVLIIFVTGYIFAGKLFVFENGTCVEFSAMPPIATAICIISLLYLPAIAIIKMNKLSKRIIFMLGIYGILPVTTTVIYAVTNGFDYTPVATTFAILIVCVLLQNRLILDHEKEYKIVLEGKNSELANANAETVAQLDEIKTLNTSLTEYKDILANAGYGVWHIILKDGVAPRMQVNEKMAELLGINPDNLSEEEIYSSWYDRVLEEAVPSVNASVQEMIDGQFSENTYQWNHPYKGIIYVRCGGTALILPDGTKFLKGYHADVTQFVVKEQQFAKALGDAKVAAEKHNEELAKQLEIINSVAKALEEATAKANAANEAKTAFLFNMSHDIRTPMNAIIGYTDLLEKYHADPAKNIDYISKIRSSSKFLLSLINNVLEMARIESGNATLDEAPVYIRNVFNDTQDVYSELMKNKHISFTQTIDIKTQYIYSDIVKINKILLNLVSNAFKYTPEDGEILMSVEELPSDKDGYTVLKTVIKDTGIGMSKEYLPHLFDEFSREHNATEAGIEGTGLGMPIVKRLVELMGGEITCDSELGKGTTFVVIIPFRIAEEPQNKFLNNTRRGMEGCVGKRLLLAEDNDLNAEIAEELLRDTGFLVERAVDGIACVDMLQKAEAGYYDLILMDIQMPNMDGIKATRIIRKLDDLAKKDIPIIAMTANAFDEDRKNAIDAGMNAHLSKPIVIDELIDTIISFLL